MDTLHSVARCIRTRVQALVAFFWSSFLSVCFELQQRRAHAPEPWLCDCKTPWSLIAWLCPRPVLIVATRGWTNRWKTSTFLYESLTLSPFQVNKTNLKPNKNNNKKPNQNKIKTLSCSFKNEHTKVVTIVYCLLCIFHYNLTKCLYDTDPVI